MPLRLCNEIYYARKGAKLAKNCKYSPLRAWRLCVKPFMNGTMLNKFLKSALVTTLLLAGYPLHAQETILRQPAQVEPYEQASIVAKASGFVSKVNVDLGDSVKRGDVLIELSIPEMEQERLRMVALVEQADAAIRQSEARVAASQAKIAAAQSQVVATKAELVRHQAEIQFARSELSRISTLVSSRSINASMQDEKQRQLDAAQAALASDEAKVKASESNVLVARADEQQSQADLSYAKSQLKVAQASLAYTEAVMQYATIRAPFDGLISHRKIDTGDFVMSAASAAGEPLLTLNRIGRFRIVFDVPESSATMVKIGQKVELRLDSLKEQVFTGELKRTSGQLDKRTRTLRVEAEVEDLESKLKPGMYGIITTQIN